MKKIALHLGWASYDIAEAQKDGSARLRKHINAKSSMGKSHSI